MSKETQLSETAGAQVSDLSSKKYQPKNIYTKEDKGFHKVSQKRKYLFHKKVVAMLLFHRWLRWQISCKTMQRSFLKGDHHHHHYYQHQHHHHIIIITIVEIIREGKLQEMESRAEKLEQGTVIFQVGAAIPPPILNKDSSSHPHVTNMLPSCHPPATLMSPHVILLPSSCNPPNISSRASSFLKSSWPQNQLF